MSTFGEEYALLWGWGWGGLKMKEYSSFQHTTLLRKKPNNEKSRFCRNVSNQIELPNVSIFLENYD